MPLILRAHPEWDQPQPPELVAAMIDRGMPPEAFDAEGRLLPDVAAKHGWVLGEGVFLRTAP